MTVGEMDARMGASEFAEWLHYLALDPRPEDSCNALLAQLCALVAGAFHNPKGGRKAPTAQDFLRSIYPRKKGDASPDRADWTDRQRETWQRSQIARLNAAARASQKAAT
jgi:hypothetical protein